MATLAKKAKAKFGITKDGREAGYILPSGELLDFSGKLEGFSAHQRQFDHREILRIMGSKKISGEDARELFEQSGPIRMGVHPKYADVIVELNTYQHPTEQQWSRIKQMVAFVCKVRPDMSLGYDIYNGERITIKSEWIRNARPVHVERIRRDLKRAQDGEFDEVQEFNIFRWARGL